MSKGLVDGIRNNIDSILGLRDSIGAGLKEVFLIERTWSGSELGDGTYIEKRTRMLPSPRVVEFKHDLRLTEGGAVQQGDILLKMVSKQTFPTLDLVDCTSEDVTVEKIYEVGGILYRVISVTEKLVTWTILLRKLSQQARI